MLSRAHHVQTPAIISHTHSRSRACSPQAFAQIPDLHVWYGPDSYMGANLAQLFTALSRATDEDVAALHPAHTVASVRGLLPRLHYFAEGVCIVHHMFGADVTDLVKTAYPDALLTAHFEVCAAACLDSLRKTCPQRNCCCLCCARFTLCLDLRCAWPLQVPHGELCRILESLAGFCSPRGVRS